MIFCCPYCHNELILVKNVYLCQPCNIGYKYQHNIYYFYDPEASHWIKIQKTNQSFDNESLLAEKNYDNFMKIGDYEYPYLPPDQIDKIKEDMIMSASANGAMLNYVFESIYGKLNEPDFLPLLNIGASHCWESYFFARYKPVIALNVNEHVRWLDPKFGQGITRVIADGQFLPIKDETIGIIFMCSTYHHMEDKDGALDEWYRVLTPGGLLIAVGESPSSIEDKSAMVETGEYGYTNEEMMETFKKSRFRGIERFPIQYCQNMQYKYAVDLTGTQVENGIIIGVK